MGWDGDRERAHRQAFRGYPMHALHRLVLKTIRQVSSMKGSCVKSFRGDSCLFCVVFSSSLCRKQCGAHCVVKTFIVKGSCLDSPGRSVNSGRPFALESNSALLPSPPGGKRGGGASHSASTWGRDRSEPCGRAPELRQ